MDNKFKKFIDLIPEEIRAEVLTKIQKCADVESLKAIVKEYNLPIGDEMLEPAAAYLTDGKIMDENDLSAVSGGTVCGGTSLTPECPLWSSHC